MTHEEMKRKLELFIKSTELRIRTLSDRIDDLSITKKAEKENRDEILELYKDIKEEEIRVDMYYFIGHELEIF